MSDMALDRVDPTALALERASVPSPLSGGQPTAAPKESASDTLMRQLSESQKRTESIIAQEEREKAPVVDAALEANRAPMPAVPRLGRETAPPKQDIGQRMQDWLLPIVALSSIAGAFSRQHATTALNAFAAGMQGLKEGNLTLYDQKVKEWKAANERLLANNEAAMKEYNAAWTNRKNNIDQKMNEIQLIASKYQDRLTYEAAAQKNFTLVAQLLQKQEMLQEKLQVEYEKLKVANDASNTKMEALRSKMESADPFAMAERLESIKDPAEKERAMNMIKALHPQGAMVMAGEGGQAAGLFGPDTIKQMVDRRLAGDKSVLQNVGRGTQGAMNVVEFNKALAAEMQARGMSGQDLAKIDQQYVGGTAFQRAAGGQAARVEVASNEVEQVLPQAIEASKTVPRGKFVPINRLMQDWQKGTSDPAYNDFIMANFSLINAYTRAMNPQGVPRIAERLEQKAEGILNTATSQQAYEVQARRLWKEVQASKNAVSRTREGVTGGDINAPVPGLDTTPSGGNVIRYDAEGNRIP